MDDKKISRQALRLTARSSPLAIRLSIMAVLLMSVGIVILVLSRYRQHWTLPIGLTAVGIAVVLYVVFGSAATAKPHPVRAMLLYIYGPALVPVLIVLWIDGLRRWRSLRQRIGTDGSALLYDPGSGEVRRYEWDQVLANRRSLLAGAKMIPLYGGRRHEAPPIFPSDELRELVLARLPRSAFVGDLRFWWTALRRGSAIVIWQCIGIALALGLLIAPPERFAALRAMYQGFIKSQLQ